MSLRRAVCLGLLVTLPACGGDPAADEAVELEQDAGMEMADANSPTAVGDASSASIGDASSVRTKDEAMKSADGGVGLATDAGALGELADAGHACVPGLYADDDSDGFVVIVRSSTCPVGDPTNIDCYDSNKLAHPGQTGRFATDRGDGSFDYDCDGKETGIYTNVAVCPDVSGWTCPPASYRLSSDFCDYNAQVEPFRVATEGWTVSVPACGDHGQYGLELDWDNVAKVYSCSKPLPSPGDVGKQIQICN